MDDENKLEEEVEDEVDENEDFINELFNRDEDEKFVSVEEVDALPPGKRVVIDGREYERTHEGGLALVDKNLLQTGLKIPKQPREFDISEAESQREYNKRKKQEMLDYYDEITPDSQLLYTFYNYTAKGELKPFGKWKGRRSKKEIGKIIKSLKGFEKGEFFVELENTNIPQKYAKPVRIRESYYLNLDDDGNIIKPEFAEQRFIRDPDDYDTDIPVKKIDMRERLQSRGNSEMSTSEILLFMMDMQKEHTNDLVNILKQKQSAGFFDNLDIVKITEYVTLFQKLGWLKTAEKQSPLSELIDNLDKILNFAEKKTSPQTDWAGVLAGGAQVVAAISETLKTHYNAQALLQEQKPVYATTITQEPHPVITEKQSVTSHQPPVGEQSSVIGHQSPAGEQSSVIGHQSPAEILQETGDRRQETELPETESKPEPEKIDPEKELNDFFVQIYNSILISLQPDATPENIERSQPEYAANVASTLLKPKCPEAYELLLRYNTDSLFRTLIDADFIEKADREYIIQTQPLKIAIMDWLNKFFNNLN